MHGNVLYQLNVNFVATSWKIINWKKFESLKSIKVRKCQESLRITVLQDKQRKEQDKIIWFSTKKILIHIFFLISNIFYFQLYQYTRMCNDLFFIEHKNLPSHSLCQKQASTISSQHFQWLDNNRLMITYR